MGIDEGIVALKQITDEFKWFNAMEEVKQFFQDKHYFKEYPRHQLGHQLFTEGDLKLLEITEPLNFHEKGKRFNWNRWVDFLRLLDYKAWEAVKSGDLSLKEALELKKDKLVTGFNQEKVHEPPVDIVTKAIEIVNNIDPQTEKRVTSDKYILSPVLYEFATGEYPRLPVFGRHFTICNSKMTRKGESPYVIKNIFKILKKYFPEHVAYFIDSESYPEVVNKTSSGDDELKEEFYNSVRDLFNDATTTDEFDTARNKLSLTYAA